MDGGQSANRSPARSTADRDFPALAANVDPPEPPEDWPDIPDQRPGSSRERTRVALRVAEWIVRNAWRATPWGRAITIGHWLYDRLPLIEFYGDAPRTLEELLNRAKTPLAGYDRHHIVERSTARPSGFFEDTINDPDNIVLIPRMQHWLINRWCARPNDEFGGLPPREFLQGKSWDEQRRVGLNALVDAGVLKP
ncbi:hypothetical protein [Georhizobium profundi]|uniref:hypothetical protein n=1 Tax=Georhizobium profundi TaxID=2341112 RepID=UPI000F7E369E|nr:hypothetical protein [Georhizobium profundi]